MPYFLLAEAAPVVEMTFKLTWFDVLIMCGAIVFNLSVGAYFSRKQTGTKSYFLGGGNLPGWLVGFSITASMISAMTFLALPGYTFKEDWFWVLPSFCFLILGVLSAYFIVPFFRRVQTPSGYAFLEQRYGTWARVYAAVGFMTFNLMRLGIVLYVTSIALEEFLPVAGALRAFEGAMGGDLPWLFHEPIFWVILILGAVATLYTMFGGLEAVIWTDFFQSMLFIFGGATLLPIILYQISQVTDVSFLGGFSEIFTRAAEAGKLSIGSTELTLGEVDGKKTLWVVMISTLFVNANDYTTRQDFIQRYRAPKDLFNARFAVILGACTVVPIWLYFNFLGTSLWVYYDIAPDATVDAFRNIAPEKIVPYFMAQYLPVGLKGFFLAAILTASLSTMAPMLNACTVTWVDDFYHRFIVRNKPDMHYVRVGRVSTCLIGVFMVTSATLIYVWRSQTLQNMHATLAMICSIGLFGLFMVGFFSKGVGNRAAFCASSIVVPLGLLWSAFYFIKNSEGFPASFGGWLHENFLGGGSASLEEVIASVSQFHANMDNWVPDIFWLTVFMNLLMIGLALLFSKIFPQEKKELKNLTIHTVDQK